jgi:probable HAF family extracellular repeat protein
MEFSMVRRPAIAAFLILVSASFALAQGTYTQIDYPGAINTYCSAINDAGEIVGFYEDTSNIWHGFTLSDGTYVAVDYPNGVGTYLTGLNNVGQAVGYAGSSGVGFLDDLQSGTFVDVIYPWAFQTVPTGINDFGEVAGWYELIDGQRLYFAGFSLVGSEYAKVVPPGASDDTYVYGVTASGEIVGQAYINRTGQGAIFLLKNSTYSFVNALSGNSFALMGVNSTGSELVGYSGADGFTFHKGQLRTLAVPGATATYASGANKNGVVVGEFQTKSLQVHGFLWTPPAPVEKK